MQKLNINIILLLIAFISISIGQTITTKREFRAVWIATVGNIDWPSDRNATPGRKIADLVDMFDKLKDAGMNAVFFQVRTECDAFYDSEIEPWSFWLTDQQGSAPKPYFDPLDFAVSEAHERAMEVHAWFNPYRAVKKVGEYNSAFNHIAQTKPEWILTFGDYKMLDPGNPEVQEFILKIVTDVIARYDVDGIHFDDYFYPYSPKVSNEDSLTFAKYNRGISNIDDWRRDNINSLMAKIYNVIKAVKPQVKFGISPFGIVENKYAETEGFNSYSILYCDPLTWIREKIIDYINPQLYWELDHPKAAYSKLLPWWASVVGDRHLYVGHFAGRFLRRNYSGSKSELGDQIRMNRNFANVHGSVFFSARTIVRNAGGFVDTLKNDLYKYPALPPTMPWKDSIPPFPPKDLVMQFDTSGISLSWEKPEIASDGDRARAYVIYRFDSIDSINLDDPSKIVQIVNASKTRYRDNFSMKENKQVVYVVTSLDKLFNESKEYAMVSMEINE